LIKVGALKIRLWGDRDVARLRKALAERRRNRRKPNGTAKTSRSHLSN
jgi:hypothetical protein